MTCCILVRKYTWLSNSSSSIAKLLLKETIRWQSKVTVSDGAQVATSLRLKHSRSAPVECPLGGSVGLTDGLLNADFRCPSWHNIREGKSRSNHLLQVESQHWKNSSRRSYCMQPRSDGSGTTTSTQVAGDSTEVQLSQREKLKRAVKEYGSTVIVFHITISLASLGGFYLAVSSGIDMVGMLKSLGVGETILQSKLAAGTGTFVVAYAVHKVFAPVRIGITLTCTPLIVRYLRSKGILKPPKPKA